MNETLEMIEKLIEDGYTVTISPIPGTGYFDQPITEYLVVTSKDGVNYGEGCQAVLANAVDDAWTLTPSVDAEVRR